MPEGSAPVPRHAHNAFRDLLAARPWLMADGATGTSLFAAGLEAGEAPDLWNIDAPDKIRALHQSFVDAGSDLILTNSFGGTRQRLKLHGAQDRAYEINRRAAELAREVADKAGRPVIVAGSMGPTGELLEPVGTLTMEEATQSFLEQAQGLVDGGVDVLWGETISSQEEMEAISRAAHALGAPFCGTLSFDTAGRTMMGVTSTAYARIAPALPQPPLAFGANCGVGASDLLRTVLGLHDAAPEAVLIAKANAGIPKYVDGAIEYDGSPALMARYAVLARRAGARIIGGCCGTTPAHLVAMRAALTASDAEWPLAAPSLEEIVAATGAFSSESDGAGAHAHAHAHGGGEGGGRRRGGRRRG